MTFFQKLLALALSFLLLFGTIPQQTSAAPAAAPQETYADLSDSDLDALVAPIALYPDALVAQVLGAATFPDQVVDADTFVKSNSGLTGQALQDAVQQKDWDPAVQAVTQFPSVLDTLAKNISWTSALGDASATQQDAVLAAVQRMRAQAYAAGNLKSGSQIKVVQESPQVIVIQPANPQIVYVPAYNPAVVYGTPVVVPGYSTGDVVAASIISFGVGIAIGAAINRNSCGYGYHSWGMSWNAYTISCGGGYYYGNPYWRGGYYPGYRPGYRPPYYPPPRPPHYRPPYPGNPGRPPGIYPPPNNGRPPTSGRPPYPGKPTPLPAPVPGRPNPGQPGNGPNPGQPGRPNPGQPGKPNPGVPTTRPTPQPSPRPTPGRPSTLPVPTPSTRPAPVPSARPTGKDMRGYPQTPAAKPAPAAKPNAFSGSAGGRPQSARGNRSMSASQQKAAPRR